MEGRRAGIKRVVQLLFLTHGLGVLAGFAVFWFLFQTQCAELLQINASKHNITIMSIRHEYESWTVDDRAACQRKLLNEQTALIERHLRLVHAHDEALSQIRMQNFQLDDLTERVKMKDDEMSLLKSLLDKSEMAVTNTKRWATKEQEMLKNQLTLTKTMLKQCEDEVFLLNTATSSRGDVTGVGVPMRSDINEDKFIQIQASIRRLNLAQIKQTFGEAPYRVQFTLAPHDDQLALSLVEIEIEKFDDMAHSVYTFLSLVDAGLYEGTSIHGHSDGTRIEGGHPKSSTSKHVQTQLIRRYGELAYGSFPLLFTEVSVIKPCNAFFIGFVDRGPDFVIQLTTAPSALPSCFGRIIRGEEAITAISKDERVITIINTRILKHVTK